MLDWNSYHLLLLISRKGTLTAAAAESDVNETTVARRLAAAEAVVGMPIFKRAGGKLVPTATGTSLLSAAQAMEKALTQLPLPNSGVQTLRVSALPMVIDQLIAPRVGEFSRRHPHIVLEVVASTATHSLARRDAEIALRLNRPSEGMLIIRKARDVRFRPVAARSAVSVMKHALPYFAYEREYDDLPEIAAMKSRHGSEPSARFSSLSAILAAVKAGAGAAMLPDLLFEDEPDLEVLDHDVVVSRPLWIVFHENVRQKETVRLAADWFAEILTDTPKRQDRKKPGKSQSPNPTRELADQ
ncbi:LysR family transcriptional regulator [uncultured Roseibium sp.]|uniref:LysR family transcriptional regulator n=1 Tax=uncultured Roseibium sp. TaxID=1936171 RepID=UPI0025970B64|nr:LysR family transcriptional regulator [uncultured Roseibium sp.]